MSKQKSGMHRSEPRPRGGRARRMGEMLPEIGGVAFRRFGFVQSSIITRWSEIVGERYARASSPESIRFPQGKREQGTLSVIVTGAHAPMMQHASPAIIERVNRFFGYEAVIKLAIRQGEIIKPAAKIERLQPAPLPTELGDSLRTVADPELRAVLESLAQSVIAADAIQIAGKIS